MGDSKINGIYQFTHDFDSVCQYLTAVGVMLIYWLQIVRSALNPPLVWCSPP